MGQPPQKGHLSKLGVPCKGLLWTELCAQDAPRQTRSGQRVPAAPQKTKPANVKVNANANGTNASGTNANANANGKATASRTVRENTRGKGGSK